MATEKEVQRGPRRRLEWRERVHFAEQVLAGCLALERHGTVANPAGLRRAAEILANDLREEVGE